MSAVLDHNSHGAKSRAAAISIISNASLIVFKLVIGLMSGSISIMSEALHSGSDLVASVIAFFSVRQSAKPADDSHRYGHEKMENVSGVLEALLILVAAVVIIVEGVHKIIDGVELEHVWLGVAVMLVSAIVNLVVSRLVLDPVARATDSAALEADAAHLMTDVYTSLGVAFGLTLVQITGYALFDPIAAITVACLIIVTAFRLIRNSTRILLDATLPADELELIRKCVADHRGDLIIGYHKLRARQAGSRRHIDLHIVVDDAMTVGEAHDVAEHIQRDIQACVPNSDVLVHVEPAEHDREDGS